MNEYFRSSFFFLLFFWFSILEYSKDQQWMIRVDDVMFIDVWYVMLFDVFLSFRRRRRLQNVVSRRQKVKTSLHHYTTTIFQQSQLQCCAHIHIPPRSIYRFEPSQCCVLFVVWQFYTINAKCFRTSTLLDLYTLWSHLIYSFLLQYPPPVKYSVP